MAAGSIVLAHKSGGPKMDIVNDGETGFLASDIDSYATMMRHIFDMKADERQKIVNAPDRVSIDSVWRISRHILWTRWTKFFWKFNSISLFWKKKNQENVYLLLTQCIEW